MNKVQMKEQWGTNQAFYFRTRLSLVTNTEQNNPFICGITCIYTYLRDSWVSTDSVSLTNKRLQFDSEDR